MKRLRALLFPLLLSCLLLVGAGCGSQVQDLKATLRLGKCASDGLSSVEGVWTALVRQAPYMELQGCADTYKTYTTLDEVQAKLAQHTILEPIPEPGLWDLWVVGTGRSCCQDPHGAIDLLCGRVGEKITLPPPGNRLDVTIHCTDQFSAGGKTEAAQAVKNCAVGHPTLNQICPPLTEDQPR